MISFSHVSKYYTKNIPAILDATFTIKDKEFVFLVGRSGAGKSTLLQMMCYGLFPSKGEITIDGRALSDIPKAELPYLRRRFGVVSQEDRLLEYKTVYENIAFVLEVTEQPRKLAEELVPKALGLLGMRKKADVYPQELSGGERLRAALCRAVVLNPSYLILDEPTANLDRDLGWDIMCLLREINYCGVTVIMATHDKEFVNLMKKRVITLSHGRIIGDAKNARYGDVV